MSWTPADGEGPVTLQWPSPNKGVAMLSSVLTSYMAMAVNIRIVQVFTRMRQMLSNNEEFLGRLEALEQKLAEQGEDIETIFGYLKELLDPEQPPRRRMGYKLPGENKDEDKDRS